MAQTLSVSGKGSFSYFIISINPSKYGLIKTVKGAIFLKHLRLVVI